MATAVKKNKGGRPERKRSSGEPITADRSYTFHQLKDALGCSAVTLWRRINEHGLSDYGTKVGADWLFTGRKVLEWIETTTDRKGGEMYVLVWEVIGKQVVPLDCNPEHDDEGLLVYSTKDGAEAAARYQTEMYADDLDTVIAIPLVEFMKRTKAEQTNRTTTDRQPHDAAKRN